MKTPIISVVGSIHMDFTVVTDHLPASGETVIGDAFKMSPGGKGANQAVSSSRLGAKVCMVGRVGRDYLGTLLLKNLRKNGVNTDYVIRDSSAYTGLALITVDNQGRNSITVAPGTDALVTKEDVDRAMPMIARSSALLLQLEIPMDVVVYAAEEASTRGVKVFLNPAPFKPIPEELYRNLYVLTPNEVEVTALAGINLKETEALEEVGLGLLEKGAKNVVITMGSRGAFLVTSKKHVLVPAYKVKVVDTTGAGDAFNAALAVSVTEGSSLKEAVRFANLVAACKVTKLGAQEGLPKRTEVMDFRARLSMPE